jgi:hypothetical protein
VETTITERAKMKRTDLKIPQFEIYFQNWKNLSKSIDMAGGNAVYVLENAEDFLLTLATNNIKIESSFSDPNEDPFEYEY